jgi:hypothetical protein
MIKSMVFGNMYIKWQKKLIKRYRFGYQEVVGSFIIR